MNRATLQKAVVPLLLLAVIVSGPVAASAAPPAGTGANDGIRELQRSLREETDAVGQARLHKRIGDLFAERGDFRQASAEYLSAFSLSPDFPSEERFRMARVLSWAGRLDEAIAELERILAENPGNRAARIHLARCLSWKGRLGRAEREIHRVLAEHPDDREAILVKANLLRWRGDLRRAVAHYRQALGGEEEFGARTGLAYAFLSGGDVRMARAERNIIKAEHPFQERELVELDRAIRAAERPAAEGGYAYYSDSDDNRVEKISASLSAWASVARLGLSFRHFDARDNARHADAREASLSAFSRVTESAGFHASAGFHESRAGLTGEFFTGSARLELLMPRGNAAASASREILTDTAQLVGNSVRVSAFQISLSQYLGCGVTADGSYGYREYSDDNRSKDLSLSVRHAFDVKAPFVSAGYRFRFRDFSRETGSGYFDPSNYISHQLFLALSHDGKRVVAYMEPYVGHEEFDRRGTKTSQWIGGGSGSLGVKIREGWILEGNVEGGSNSSGAAAGFDYYQAGVRIRATF